MENFSIKWQALEYEPGTRSNDWFWAVGIITISLATLIFIYDDFLFGILVVLSGMILIYFAIRKPTNVDYEIDNKGISINQKRQTYQSIDCYWLETRVEEPKIILKLKKEIFPYMTIPVPVEAAEEIDSFLKNFLKEEEIQIPASNKIMEYLGF